MIKKVVYLVIAICLVLQAACTTTVQDPENPAPSPRAEAPITTWVPKIPSGTPEIEWVPKVIPSNKMLPPGITIIHMTAPPEVFESLKQAEKEAQIHQQAGDITESIVLVGLLSTLAKGIEIGFCRKLADDTANHMLEDGATRLRRLGGWKGAEAFAENLMAGQYMVDAVVSSFSIRRAAFWLTMQGKKFLLILSEESLSTVIPLASTQAGVDLVENFLVISAGKVEKGLIFSTREIGAVLGAGTLGLNILSAAQWGGLYTSLAKFGGCLLKRIQKEPGYQEWKTKQQANSKPDDPAIKFDLSYANEADLLADITLLESLGISHNLVNNAPQKSAGVVIMLISGGFLAVTAAPVVFAAGSAAAVTEETVRYTIMLSAAAAVP